MAPANFGFLGMVWMLLDTLRLAAGKDVDEATV